MYDAYLSMQHLFTPQGIYVNGWFCVLYSLRFLEKAILILSS